MGFRLIVAKSNVLIAWVDISAVLISIRIPLRDLPCSGFTVYCSSFRPVNAWKVQSRARKTGPPSRRPTWA